MRLEYFQLIDRIVELDTAERKIRCEADVPTQSTIFEGHFPGNPLLPGVLLGETMAQASGWLIIGVQKFARMPFLAGFKEAKFRTFVKPGQRLIVDARIEHEGSGFVVTKADIRSDGARICDAQITFRTIEFPNTEMSNHMREFAKKIAFPMDAMT